jgi:hypothetical protein
MFTHKRGAWTWKKANTCIKKFMAEKVLGILSKSERITEDSNRLAVQFFPIRLNQVVQENFFVIFKTIYFFGTLSWSNDNLSDTPVIYEVSNQRSQS